jgi:hypothetical protein
VEAYLDFARDISFEAGFLVGLDHRGFASAARTRPSRPAPARHAQ